VDADAIALDSLSPFELQDELGRYAAKAGTGEVLDAGKGQPNWLAVEPRHAFHLLGRFALGEAERRAARGTAGGSTGAGWTPPADGVADRLHAHLAHKSVAGQPGAALLGTVVDHGVDSLGFDADAWVGELVLGILGDRYPQPHRMLDHVERLVHEYLVVTHGIARSATDAGSGHAGRFRLFATEGAAAAMSYCFQSLRRNGLLGPGDKVAVATPVFSPYLQIPHMAEFGFEIVHVQADEGAGWRYPMAEMAKLLDPGVKAFFVVNPGNPGTRSLDADELALIKEVVEERPDLMILTDTAYATFVDGFRSLLAELPHQTLGVHSFSKNFGATGERVAFIAVHEDHVIDRLLREQAPGERGYRAERYRTVTDDVDHLAFVDRVVADSREVALYHIAGLATPQQVKMALFAGFALLDPGREYLAGTRQVLERRLGALLGPLELDMPVGADTHYCTLLDVAELARRRHGDDFARWLLVSQHPLTFPLNLARHHGVVALPGRGFEAASWSIRVSLANLPDEAYPTVAAAVHATIDDLHSTYAHHEGVPR
jgi:aspartate 4-decarboxylase